MPVTAADRETAEQLAKPFLDSMSIDAGEDLSEDIAAALAEQRERHVADLESIQSRLAQALWETEEVVHDIAPEVVQFCRERIAELKGE